jgi:hypothetical protein
MKQKSHPIEEDLNNTKKTNSLFELTHIVQHTKGDQACQASSFSNKGLGYYRHVERKNYMELLKKTT